MGDKLFDSEVVSALKRGGFTDEIMKKACSGNNFGLFVEFLCGHAEIRPKRKIDCDGQIFIPHNWTQLSEERQPPKRVRGKILWNPSKIELWLADGQKNGRSMTGNQLLEEIMDKPVYSDRVLFWLLAHPGFIPEVFKEKTKSGDRRYFPFWGTLYQSPDEEILVQCICWNVITWDLSYMPINDEKLFDDSYPAIMEK